MECRASPSHVVWFYTRQLKQQSRLSYNGLHNYQIRHARANQPSKEYDVKLLKVFNPLCPLFPMQRTRILEDFERNDPRICFLSFFFFNKKWAKDEEMVSMKPRSENAWLSVNKKKKRSNQHSNCSEHTPALDFNSFLTISWRDAR